MAASRLGPRLRQLLRPLRRAARAVRRRVAGVEREFRPHEVPWIDRPGADVRAYVRSLPELPGDYDLEEKLTHWRDLGYVVFEGAADPRLMDAYQADLRELIGRHHDYEVMVTHEARGRRRLRELSAEDLRFPHYRLCDVHNVSVAGKGLVLNPRVVSFLGHAFGEPVVVMQSLTFAQSSEQGLHQDYAYVVAKKPGFLAASWLALEDVHPDAGPLGYLPGSHRIPKFDWGDGLFLTPESRHDEADFRRHIERQCRRLGLSMRTFLPRRGDLLIWHASLAHEGMPVRDRSRTRLSLVSHFSSLPAYPRDRRAPDVVPVRRSYNGGYLYVDPTRPAEEDRLAGGAAL
jgi:ectoine hydroxylase-related dioxygenase (phytanoyl-CoA dioxygenase family)